MDPRHPEQAISRMDQLIEQFKATLDKIRTNTVSSRIGQLEREGGLVVQEICLVAPRLHEAMIQASRQRRHDLTRGVVENPVEKPVEKSAPKPGMMDEATADKILDTIEKVAPAPKKKATRKKRTAKKADV